MINYNGITTSQSDQNYVGTLLKRTISGYVRTSADNPLAGVTISGLPGSPSTDASGYYSATVDCGWSGTASPVLSGYSFAPASKSYSGVGEDQTNQNYTGTAAALVISGYVRTAAGAAIPGVQISGLPVIPSTDASGFYSAAVSTLFTGTAAPSLTCYSFSPPSVTYSGITTSQSNQNYTGTQLTYTISGHVRTLAGSPLAGVTVSGLPGASSTDATGFYNATVNCGWTGTASPALAGYSFEPTAKSYYSVSGNMADQDYTGQNSLLLTITKGGSGNGTVTSIPTGINCGAACSAGFPFNQQVTLSAQPDGNSAFTGWGGACGGTGGCVVTMSSPRSVTASFEACTVAVSPDGTAAPASGATGSFTVTSGPGCSWSASPNVTWIRVINGSSGIGPGAVTYVVDANTSASQRTGSIVVSGRLFTVTQAANSCTYSLSPVSADVPQPGGIGALAVAAAVNCPWSSFANAPWIKIESAASGTGNGSLVYSVAANPEATPRTGTLMVAGLTFTVRQEGLSCSFSITPSSRTHGFGSESAAVNVSTGQGCIWSAQTDNSWVIFLSSPSGSGPGSVFYSVAANTSGRQRSGTATIAGQSYSITQDAPPQPVISSLNPSSAVAGGGVFDLVVDGLSFGPGSVVRWNGADRPTVFLGISQLRAVISASDISLPGEAQIAVVNPGGPVSSARSFVIRPFENPPPTLLSLHPFALPAGSPGFSLSVMGSNFVPGSVIRWNGSSRPTFFESPTLLTALIPATDIAAAGSQAVAVFNPVPGGGLSSPASFEVRSGLSIADLSPNIALAGGSDFKLTVFGLGDAGVVSGSGEAEAGSNRRLDSGLQILWNGQPLATTQLSDGQLVATVPAALIAATGQATITLGNGRPSSNPVTIPIILFNPVPVLKAIDPPSGSPGGSSLTLSLTGRNFTSASQVLWDGQRLETEFVDSTTIRASVPEGSISRPGVASLAVRNPALGGGDSEKRTFSFVPALLYPRLASAARSSTQVDDSESTGIVLVNLGSTPARVTLTAFDVKGSLLSGTEIANPSSIEIEPHHQLPVVSSQVFGKGMALRRDLGWFKAESTAARLGGFFLTFSDSVSTLDGTDVSGTTHTSFVLPEIEEPGFTQIHALNPDSQTAWLQFEVHASDGTPAAPAAIREVSTASMVSENLSTLFPRYTPHASDYIRVISNRGVVLFEYLGQTGRYVEGLNGLDAVAGSRVLYSPQYVVGGPDWWSALSVVNLDEQDGRVTFRFIGNDGVAIGAAKTLPIAGHGKIHISDQKFFLDAGSTASQGYLEITSDGPRLTGSIVFGDPERSRYSTALPLISQLRSSMVFGQLASDETYYTGLALVNPGNTVATATLEAYDRDGNLAAIREESIPAHGRSLGLLTQYFPSLVGQSRSSGYILVRATGGLAGYAVFGTQNGTALAAIPPQTLP